MPRLMRARQICSDGKKISDLSQDTVGESSIWSLIALRSWVLAMAERNFHYTRFASSLIDWDNFHDHTIKRLNLIGNSDIFREDVFQDIRGEIKEMKDKLVVHRFRKKQCAELILDYLKKTLEKEIIPELNALRLDKSLVESPEFTVQEMKSLPVLGVFSTKAEALAFCDNQIQQLSVEISSNVKSNIFNALLRIPEHERLTCKSFCILMLEKYGQLSSISIQVMHALLMIYKSNARPRHFTEYIGFLEDVRQLKVITWYFSTICTLKKFQFIPMDLDSVVRVERAMKKKKYQISKHDPLSSSVYDVVFTLCCEKILTQTGQTAFGHADVSYDIDSGNLICFKNEREDQLTDEILDQNDMCRKKRRKVIRKEQKKANELACTNCPVVIVSMKGRALSYIPKQKDLNIYRHCPRCASLHIYKWTNWSGSADGTYRCAECKSQEKISQLTHRCSHCHVILSQNPLQQKCLEISSDDPTEVIKKVYFCKKHFRLAKKYAWLYSANQLREKIAKREAKENKINR